MDETRPEVKEKAPVYTVRCTRCRELQEFSDPLTMQAAMMAYYSLMDMVFCPPCSEVLHDTRLPHLRAATDAVVEEVNQYHADHPMESEKPSAAPVVRLVGNDKGDVH
jgi:hypothetical protein